MNPMPIEPELIPLLNHDEALASAEKGVAALEAERNDRWYPVFHIASNGGWINDPNGLIRYEGVWHVFYQLHPFGTQWGPMHWGHVSSKDMVHWHREPIAFAPSLEQDKDGVFSGCAVIGDDGKPRIYYTGHRWVNGIDGSDGEWQVQMLAEPRDTPETSFSKHGMNIDDTERTWTNESSLSAFEKRGMIVDCPIDEVNFHFRDPKVWKTGDTWYMTFGVSSKEKRGQMWLYTSDDMVHWTFDSVLYTHPDPDVFMLECPDFFPILDANGEEKWVIGFSAMGAKPKGFMNRNVSNAGYLVGSWTPGNAFVPETSFRLWDEGHNFYAPQSFNAANEPSQIEATAAGRQIMLGWMSPFAKPIAIDEDGWCGCLTLPREIFLGEDGALLTPPADEMTDLRIDTVEMIEEEEPLVLVSNEVVTVVEDAEALEIEMTIDLEASTSERCGLHVHVTPGGDFTAIVFDAQTGCVVVDRSAGIHGDRGYRAAPLSEEELARGTIDLRVYIDRGCVEVYVEGGRHVLSSYSLPGEGPRAVQLVSESGTMTVNGLRYHRLRPIF